MPPLEESRYRLLVEGKDDKWSIINLMMKHGINWDSKDESLPYIHDHEGIEGKDRLLGSIEVSIKNYYRLGIILDADDRGSAYRWEQLTNIFNRINIELPDSPEKEGTIISGILPDSLIGIWIMPDNSSPGKLENFLARLIPVGDLCWPYADEATNHARDLGAPFSQNDQIKARIHTWLAWQKEPGRPYGIAITARYFEKDSQEALTFVSWFKRLFLED